MNALLFGDTLHHTDAHPIPCPDVGEARVRVHVAGICNTDLEIVRGYMGFRGVLGHEFVGTVETCDDPIWIGRRVVGEINCGCGECPQCLAGDPRHCCGRTVLGIRGRDGAFAEKLVLPLRNLQPVPDTVPDEVAVFTEPLAAAFEILEQVPVRSSDRVTVLGDGKLGLLVAQVIATTGCALRVVGKYPEKLRLLHGIDTTMLDHWDPSREHADIVVECSGSSTGFEMAVAALRPRGTLVLKSTVSDALRLHLAPLVIHEIHIVGSRCGPFAPALRALAEGRVDVSSLVHARFPLRDGVRAFELASALGVLKVLLYVGE